MALVIVGGGISTAYLARHKVLGQLFNWKVTIVLNFLVAFVSALVAAIAAMAKGM